MRHLEIFTGRIGVIEDLKEFTGGCVLNFSVAETPRIKKGEEWVDGPTVWTRVTVFGDMARNVQRSIKPGTMVTIIGDRKASEYVTKDTNEKRSSQAVVAEQVSIAITRYNFVSEMGSVNYSKNEAPVLYSSTDSTPKQQSAPTPSPVATSKKESEPADPFAESSSDPFGDDDDPFGLNS